MTELQNTVLFDEILWGWGSNKEQHHAWTRAGINTGPTLTLGGAAACLASSASHSCSRRASFCSVSSCLRLDSSSCRVESSSCRWSVSTLELFSSSSRSSSARRRSLCRAWLSQRDTSLRRDSTSCRTQSGFKNTPASYLTCAHLYRVLTWLNGQWLQLQVSAAVSSFWSSELLHDFSSCFRRSFSTNSSSSCFSRSVAPYGTGGHTDIISILPHFVIWPCFQFYSLPQRTQNNVNHFWHFMLHRDSLRRLLSHLNAGVCCNLYWRVFSSFLQECSQAGSHQFRAKSLHLPSLIQQLLLQLLHLPTHHNNYLVILTKHFTVYFSSQ